jgi:RHS repeat-associated protein
LYYPFGWEIPTLSYTAKKYRFGFNGKEDDREWHAQDYGFRLYTPRESRFISVDPITEEYPELTPYQFASNTPIQAVDLDGLEGVQYIEKIELQSGATIIKRIVEIDIYVAISEKKKTNHFRLSNLSKIHVDLNEEFNKDFKDADGNIVEFRFNMNNFNADEILPADFAKKLRTYNKNGNNPNHEFILNGEGQNILAQKGFVLEKNTLKGQKDITGHEEGVTRLNHVIINKKALDKPHTIAHEITHIFLSYNMNNNPQSTKAHDEAGGIFFYKKIDKYGNTVAPTRNLNQNNVDNILKSLPIATPKVIKK